MSVIKGLKDINALLEKPKYEGTGQKVRWVKLADGQSAKVRFVEELDQEKLPILLTNKYQSLEDAKDILGDVANISRLFIEFQAHLYKQRAA